MTVKRWLILVAALAVIAVPAFTGAEEMPVAEPVAMETAAGTSWLEWLAGRLEAGTRIEYFTLRQNRKGGGQTFLGTIDRMDEVQNLWPARPFVTLMARPWIGAELGWQSMVARTRTNTENPSVGNFRARGPSLECVVRYPNTTAVTPYGGLGIVFYDINFKHDRWWRRGYPSYAYWNHLGRPRQDFNNTARRLDPDNALGMAVSAGCMTRLAESWSIDAYVRYTMLDANTRYTLLRHGRVREDRGKTKFPLDHYAAGVGVRYRF